MTGTPPKSRIAFYAPMKSPHHPVPSGDREMARNLIGLLEGLGCEVTLVSELRSHEKHGDPEAQARFEQAAREELARLQAADTRPPFGKGTQYDAWITYHNYYKAPDILGPSYCRDARIPYLQIESTRAKKRLSGPWARFALLSHVAADAADVIFYLTKQDQEALERDRPQGQRLIALPPFLPVEQLPNNTPAPTNTPPMILSVGMMRPGDKLASFRLIAETLARLQSVDQTVDWQLVLAGDGPARAEVEALMTPFGPRVRSLGQQSKEALAELYQQADVFFWPGVNEAFGMVYLEAQANGLPVLAQDRPGLRDILAPMTPPAPDPQDGPDALAAQLRTLLTNSALRIERGTAGMRYVGKSHLLPAARTALKQGLAPFLKCLTP